MKYLVYFLFILTLACASKESQSTFAEQFAKELGTASVDYSDMNMWGCTSEKSDDVCDRDYSATRIEGDGTTSYESYTAASDTDVDCFYIYPTMDWSPYPGNHEDLTDVAMPLSVIEIQAGRFSEVCRVFAPLYRQATIGSYMADASEAEGIFKKAFLDVATAFEYYLKNWNNGRRMVIMGHSQGAQMASYLLHKYFDGSVRVTDIKGSETSDELRARLVLALPIGFNVFTPDGAVLGGSFTDIPLCTSPAGSGCVIHYRSYSEGTIFNNSPSAYGSTIDSVLAAQGFLNRPFNPDTDVIACVNPSLTSLPAGDKGYDRNDNEVQPGDIRVLQGTYLYGLFAGLLSDIQTTPVAKHIPGRYTATCRRNQSSEFLAIGLHEVAGTVDVRDDPLNIKSADNLLGLHLYDFTLTLGELIEQLRIKANSM